jgi:AcrR family transcriptional regulator
VARPIDVERRRAIVQSASEVIRARGLHRTTMSDVAAAAGMKRPTLYWYFKDLAELCEGIVDLANEELESFVLERIAGLSDALSLLEAVVVAQQEFFAERRELVVVLLQLWANEQGDSSQQGHAGSADKQARFADNQARFAESIRARLVEVVSDAVASGDIAPCDPDELVAVVLAAGDGAMIQHAAIGLDPKRTLHGLRRHILGPLKPAKKPIRKRRSASR